MKTKRWMILLLTIVMLMAGCAADTPEETAAPTEATQMPTEAPIEAPTEAPTEPTEPEGLQLAETVLPDTDAATGTLKFYIKDQEIYAGGPVSTLLNAGVTTYDDMDQILQPWHISSVLRVRVELEDTKEKDLPFVFFMAINASNEPKSVRESLFYSVTINTDKGVRFGSGHELEAFVTGETTYEELAAAYGEPDYNRESNTGSTKFREIAYYEPFNCAYFSFKNGVVRQIYTYYAANIYGELADSLDYKFEDCYFGNDCYILMNQYMDVMPYIAANEAAAAYIAEVEEKQEIPEEAQGNYNEVNNAGVVEKLTESITLNGEEMTLGILCTEMPELFGSQFWDQLMPVHELRYVRAGRNNPEEFYFINLNAKNSETANTLNVKGVMTRNKNYANWGKDNSAFHEFQYENLTQDSTIEDILEQYGAPMELHCTSYARDCFAWMHYEDQAGNTLRICVDPMLNQLIELRVSKYYEGEIYYP